MSRLEVADVTDCPHRYVQTGGGTRLPCPWPDCRVGAGDLGVSGVLHVAVPNVLPLPAFVVAGPVTVEMPFVERRFRRLRLGAREPYQWCWEVAP